MKPSIKIISLTQQLDYLAATITPDIVEDKECCAGLSSLIRKISEQLFETAMKI